MPGPPPKPAGQRRRRNATPGSAVLPAAGRAGRAPTLPGGPKMLPSTRAWWRTIWKSPMATVYVEADMPALVRLAQLQDLVARELQGWTNRPLGALVQDTDDESVVRVELAGAMVSVPLLAEMRQLEDRLGLTPMARLRLRWEISEDEAEAEGPGRDELADRRRRFEKAAEVGS